MENTNNIRYKILLKSDEYKIRLKKLSSEIIKSCEKAANEASVSSFFENQLYFFIRDFFGKEDLEFEKEKNVGNSVRHLFNNKRMDAVTNNLIIEYKHSSQLKSDTDIEKAINQTVNYLKVQIKAGNNYESILTDGIKIKSIHIKDDILLSSNFADINIETLDKIIKNLLFFDKKKLVGSNIANDFKIDSQNNLSKNLAFALFETIKDENIAEKTNMLFNEWRDLFHLSESDKGKNQYIDKRRKSLGEIFNCEITNNDIEYKALFCLQTTYAIIVKLTAVQCLNQITQNKDETFESIYSFNSEKLKLFFQQLEDGYLFKNIGIRNLLEGDFFAWYCDDSQWNNEIGTFIKEILDVLNSYENLKFTETYEPQDLFKDLYIGTIPQYVRHSLGEYFTPSWLADSVITNSLCIIKNDKWRGLDTCCGSGIFLIKLIGKIIENIDIPSLKPNEKKELLQDILHRVNGVDLNPLSVLTTRVNYFIAISNLIDEENNDIEIPIYLGNSAILPSIVNIDGVSCYKHSVKTKKKTIDVELPLSFIEDSNFSKTMFSIQTLVKAEKAEDIASKILNAINKQERTKIIQKKIEDLAKNLVFLHQNKWDGIWVRIITNFFATRKLGLFDIIVSNPPWVKWEYLPQSYANEIKNLCLDKHLFSGSVRTGGISLNICALISNTSASGWLSETGVLAFLMPKTLMTQPSYEGFRNFYLDSGKKKRLYIQKIDDWSKAGHPFITVQEKFLTYYFSSKIVNYSEGFPVYEYSKKRNVNIIDINAKKDFASAKICFDINIGGAKQLSKDKTNFSFIKNNCKYNFNDIIGENYYKARSGAEFTPGEIYFIKSVSNTKDINSYFFKNNSLKTAKYKVIPKKKIELETEYIYPLIKGPSIKPFQFLEDENFAIFPYDWGMKDNVSFNDLNNNCRKTAEYLIEYKKIIEQQSLKSLDLSMGNEFYALSKVGDYTFATNLVAFRDNTKMCAAVITPIDTPWGKKKMPICAKHAPYISMTKNKKYLFSWDGIPGNDNEGLIKFLKQNFGIDWVKTAKIEKIDNDKTIKVSTDKNELSLKLSDKKTEINMKIDDGRTDKFIVKKENRKLNIYKDIRYITLDEAFYICGVLNTNIIAEYISQSNDSRSVSIDMPIKLPEYNPDDENFYNISILSKEAHNLAKLNKDLKNIIANIEELYLKICKYSK